MPQPQAPKLIEQYCPQVPPLPFPGQSPNLYQQFYALAMLVGADQLNQLISQTLTQVVDDFDLDDWQLQAIGQRVAVMWLTNKVQRLVKGLPETVSGGPGCDLDARLEFAQLIDREVSATKTSAQFRW